MRHISQNRVSNTACGDYRNASFTAAHTADQSAMHQQAAGEKQFSQTHVSDFQSVNTNQSIQKSILSMLSERLKTGENKVRYDQHNLTARNQTRKQQITKDDRMNLKTYNNRPKT